MIYVANWLSSLRMSEMGQRLRQARIAAGFTSARAAADRHHWKASTYAAHENGQNEFKPPAAAAYAKAFKVDVGWLLTGRTAAGVNLMDSGRIQKTFAQILRLVSDFPNPETLAAKAAEALLDPEFSPDDDDAWLKYLGKHHPILSASEKAAPEK